MWRLVLGEWKMSDEPLDLALFPLNTVLFPGMVLPLHIFEDRYRLMINECLERDQDFGVLLVGSDPAGKRTPAVHTIGTSARITKVQRLADGRMDIVTTGLERFRVQRLLRTRPYIVALTESFPLEDTDLPTVAGLAETANELLTQYLRLTSEVLGTLIQIERRPRDASSLAYLIAISVQVSLEEKQGFLAIPTLPDLLLREVTILSREVELLMRLRHVQDSNMGYVQGPTSHLSLN
jgi:Lon protease-like protein